MIILLLNFLRILKTLHTSKFSLNTLHSLQFFSILFSIFYNNNTKSIKYFTLFYHFLMCTASFSSHFFSSTCFLSIFFIIIQKICFSIFLLISKSKSLVFKNGIYLFVGCIQMRAFPNALFNKFL